MKYIPSELRGVCAFAPHELSGFFSLEEHAKMVMNHEEMDFVQLRIAGVFDPFGEKAEPMSQGPFFRSGLNYLDVPGRK